MNIKIASTAGFCFGVKRAVEEAEKCANGEIIYTYGELIHNPQEVERLKEKGIVPIYSIDDLKNAKIIIRTHGAGEQIIAKLNANNMEIIDLTCPFVKKIHKIVNKYCNLKYKIVIIGDREHPEVIGIAGWCHGECVVISKEEEIDSVISPKDKLCVVAQTTINQDMWEKMVDKIVDICSDVLIYNTICSATHERQQETIKLASEVDAMYIVGGYLSSNTKKLFEVCKKVCYNTYHVENANEIILDTALSNIGITAGASTPSHIIKEVINVMTTNQEDQNFEQLLDQSIKTLNTGDTVRGIVVEVRPTEVVLELEGCKYNGIIKLSDLTDDPTVKPADLVEKGQELEVIVVLVSDRDGQVILSKKRLLQKANWENIKKAYETGEVLRGKVIEIGQSGLIVFCMDNKVFIPGSQVSDRFVSDLSSYDGQEVALRIIEASEGGRRRRIIGSIKAVQREETKRLQDILWADVEEGKTFTGKVKSLTDFGAFVDIGGVDGLVHISELSWKRINHPKEVISVGDELEVYIKSLDREKNKISLGYKRTEDNPWDKFIEKYKNGDNATGVVVRLVPFGVFVDIDGVDGLIHISELSWKRIAHPSAVLKEGQIIDVYIKEINMETKKVSLGYKRADQNPWEVFRSKYNVGDVVKCKVVRIASFGAFAEIIDGVDGLIHISQIALERIDKVTQVLSIGQEVEAKITEIKEDGKVSLSIVALLKEDDVIPKADIPNGDSTETDSPVADVTEEATEVVEEESSEQNIEQVEEKGAEEQ